MAELPNLRDQLAKFERPIIVAQVRLDEPRNLFEYAARQSDGHVWTSMQHAEGQYEKVADMARWAKEANINLIVRLEHTDSGFQATKLADLGAGGITVPQVTSVEQLLEAANHFYYPSQGNSPDYQGHRSSGGAGRVGDPAGFDMKYPDWWNNHGTIGVQIESLPTLRMAREFAYARVITETGSSVAKPDIHHAPVLTYLDFGPNDFRFDLGYRLRHLPDSLTPEEKDDAEAITRRVPQNVWIRAMDFAVKHAVERTDGLEAVVAMRDYDRADLERLEGQSEADGVPGRMREIRDEFNDLYAGMGVRILFTNPLHEARYIPELMNR